MKIRKIFNCMLLLTIAIFFTSFASYHSGSLRPLFLDLQECPENISITAQAYNEFDCYEYLDRNVLAQGYQPVQLFLQNNSDHYYWFSTKGINLPLASTHEVAKRVHTSTASRVSLYGIASLVMAPFAIPAIIDGFCSYHSNQFLDLDFDLKAGQDQIFAPHEYINVIFFVPKKQYQDSLSIKLLDVETHQTITISTQIKYPS